MTVGVSTDERADIESSGAGATSNAAGLAQGRGGVSDSIRRRLETMSPWQWRSWAAAAWVVAIAAILRFVNLGLPRGMVFDEVYYATEGQELLDHGVEWRTETDSAGNIVGSHADFVVHPPLGKWIIGLGIKLFQNDAWGWRFMAAVAGVLSILIIVRIARRMFRSTVLGAMAGLLMALDGMHFVLSRTAILDIFLMFFIVAAFGCLILDRDARRRRWLRELENGLDPAASGRSGRPRLTWATVPWWRLAAGVMLGAACGVKWSGVWFIPVFALLIYFWEVGLRKTVGGAHPWRDALLDEAGWIVAMVGLAFVTYLATWTGWFLSDDGWKRHYLRDELGRSEPPIIGALQNLFYYHRDMLRFHSGLTTPHQYQSWPWQWLLLARPVAFYWSGDPTCGAANCAGEILLLGTPVLWWSFIPALLGLAWFGITRRDWRAVTIGVMAAAGIVPWFGSELSNR
ncbi:MAG: dolichyl-phosphate-mannose-protein mannosyltransferase, partial [Micromonosporaceae bacterium]|nr:dolichyl-phosphate-mannose-protein mannosyltransferase [Micromonosporaceae bacterium]